ncbi:DNA polymerase zeta, partial [Apophysomyces sp. BC1034]
MNCYISTRIVNIDHYLAEPGPFDRSFCPFGNAPLKKVPVIRIFGSTPGGQQACVHVHQVIVSQLNRSSILTTLQSFQVYPYFFVPYSLPSDNPKEIRQNIYQFGVSLNHAFSLTQGQIKHNNKDQHIAAIVLVKGVPFYGYHVGYQTFLKIYLLNPSDKKRMLEILQSGAVMGMTYQPYEAHISFELQFMMDYNLYGMDLIHISPKDQNMGLKFRRPLMDEPKATFLSQSYSYSDDHPLYTVQTVPPDLQCDQQRISYCELELDIVTGSILNRLDLKERDIHTIFGEESKVYPHGEKLVSSLASIWADEEKRRVSRGDSAISSESQTEDRIPHSGWSNEEKLRTMIDSMIQRDGNTVPNEQPTFPGVMTAFQAVDALYRSEDRLPEKETDISDSSLANEYRTPSPVPENEQLLLNIMATPSRYRDLAKTTETQIDRSIIDSPSFFEDSLLEHQEELLAMIQEVEERPEENYNEDEEKEGDEEIQQWIEESGLRDPLLSDRPRLEINYDDDYEAPLFRPRKLDFTAEIQRQETISRSFTQTAPIVNEDFFNDLNVSEIPPSRSTRTKRKRLHILQNDGADDEYSELEDSCITISPKKRFQKMAKRKGAIKSEESKTTHLMRLDVQIPIENNRQLAETIEKYYMSLNHNEHDAAEQEKASRNTESPCNRLGQTSQLPDMAQSRISSPSGTIKGPMSKQQSKNALVMSSSCSFSNANINDPRRDPINGSQKSSENENTFESYKKYDHGRRSTLSSNEDGLAYFTRSIQEMWSPVLEEEGGESSFYVDPPKPLSPHDIHRRSRQPSQNILPVVQRKREYRYNHKPPIVIKPVAVYQEPFYSNPKDVPSIPKTIYGNGFKVLSKNAQHLEELDVNIGINSNLDQTLWRKSRIKVWSPVIAPPTTVEVKEWLKKTSTQDKKEINRALQHDTSIMTNSYDFKFSLVNPKSKVTRIRDYLDLFSLEIHANSTGGILPNPKQDAVQLIFWCLKTENENIASNGFQEGYHVGIIAVRDINISKIGIHDVEVDYVEDEENLIHALIEKVRLYDPDLLVGFELHNASWGYMIERATTYNIDLIDELSRVRISSGITHHDPWGYKKASVFRVVGRHMMNVWRLMRSEVDLTSYTFENLAYHLLHHRIPHYSQNTLTGWYKNCPAVLKYRLFRYYLDRVQMNLDILDASEMVNKTSESARVFGLDFYSIITRGSQLKVESVMFRIAKPENFMLISPSRKQVGQQRAIECLPMIMEPVSQFYNSPMLVLDFQSLYPFSTCLGKVRAPEDSTKFGVGNLDLPEGLLGSLKNHINVSPNGVIYVKPSIRKSLLAKMLSEALDTRVMVRRSMKKYQDDRAIKMINENERWGAKVVYGDTDSVFVYLPGRTRNEAFVIGNEISDTITKMNPAPVKLKFEKVYHPCVLLAKKRYVGHKYEKPTDEVPQFEAKGIETVRRDGTAATQKIMKASLEILFKTQDMSKLKLYLQRQWTKILSNRVPLKDFIIAKEVRLGSYSTQGLPHGAQVALAKMSIDPRAEPQHGERVPYAVVYRGPNARLKDKVIQPESLLSDPSLKLDAEYYIRKQIIPPLERVFKLLGVDVKEWYDNMPRSQKAAALSLSHFAEHHEEKA